MGKRKGAIALTMALTVAVAVPALAEQRQARFTVTAVVPKHVTVTALEQPSALTLSAEDVERGYKDVAARYQVRHNGPDGYLLRLAPRLGATRHIEVRGFATEIQLRDEAIEVRQLPATRTSDLALEFRFVLDPDARPGTYALPVHVTVTPL